MPENRFVGNPERASVTPEELANVTAEATDVNGRAGSQLDLQVAVQLAMVARFYERIGDHAVNIAEKVLYLVTGWQPEHAGAARYRTQAAEAAADATAPPSEPVD